MNNKPHHSHLRLGRRSMPGQIYLITSCTEQRHPYFADFYAGRCVVKALQEVKAADTLAFVVMPDHLHWLMALYHKQCLSRTVQFMKSRAARLINCDVEPGAKIWQSGFHDRALRRNEDVIAAARYLIANPLRAGLVETIGDYPLWDAVYI